MEGSYVRGKERENRQMPTFGTWKKVAGNRGFNPSLSGIETAEARGKSEFMGLPIPRGP